MNITALIAKAIDRIRKARAARALREYHRGFRDAMQDYDREKTLARMLDPTWLSRTPYNAGYAAARHDYQVTEDIRLRAEVAAAIKSGPRKWMPPLRPGERLVFSKEQV